MSLEKNKIKKNKTEKPKVDTKELEKKINKKMDLIKNHNLIFWFIIFPPIGLYKSYKSGFFNKWITLIITLALSLFAIIAIDVAMNPNSVSDSIVKNIVIEDGSIGTPRNVNKLGLYNNDYMFYEVLTESGKYVLYLTSDTPNDYKIDGIYKTIPNTELIKKPSLLDDSLNEVFPQILIFFNNEENINKYGTIEKVLSSTDFNQEIKTSKGLYTFTVKFDGIVNITTYNEENVQETVYTRESVINLPKEVQKFLKKNKGTTGEIVETVDCIISDKSIEYIFKNNMNRMFKVEQKNDGVLVLYR